MDHLNITMQDFWERWLELAKDYNEKKAAFMNAWNHFMNDCNSRDRKVEERKNELLAENQCFDQQLESFGSEYTAFMLDGQEEKAAAIKQQMAEISSRRAANEVLISSVDKVTYSEKLLHAAEKAFDEAGTASAALIKQKSEFRDTIESMKSVLENLEDAVSNAGDFTMESKYDLRMHRRFNHQPEDGDGLVGGPAFIEHRVVVNSTDEYLATHRSDGSRPYPVVTVDHDF